MNSHMELSDHEFLLVFENCHLPPALFNHEAHLRLAWLLLKKYNLEMATMLVCEQIQRFATKAGSPDKFDRVLTTRAVKLINHLNKKCKAETFSSFIAEFPLLQTHFHGMLEEHDLV